MDTYVIVFLTAVTTAFGAKIVEQVLQEMKDAREARKTKRERHLSLSRRVRQAVEVAQHFRSVGIEHGVPIDKFDLPDDYEGWDETLDIGL